MILLNISCSFGGKIISEEQIQEWIQTGDQYHRGQYYSAAFGWYEKAAKAGSDIGQRRVGMMYGGGIGVKQDYEKAFKWLMKAAKQEDADAQTMIGLSYNNGYGVKRDDAKAIEWLTKAAKQEEPHKTIPYWCDLCFWRKRCCARR